MPGRSRVRELTDSSAFARGSIEVAPFADGALLRVQVLPAASSRRCR